MGPEIRLLRQPNPVASRADIVIKKVEARLLKTASPFVGAGCPVFGDN